RRPLRAHPAARRGVPAARRAGRRPRLRGVAAAVLRRARAAPHRPGDRPAPGAPGRRAAPATPHHHPLRAGEDPAAARAGGTVERRRRHRRRARHRRRDPRPGAGAARAGRRAAPIPAGPADRDAGPRRGRRDHRAAAGPRRGAARGAARRGRRAAGARRNPGVPHRLEPRPPRRLRRARGGRAARRRRGPRLGRPAAPPPRRPARRPGAARARARRAVPAQRSGRGRGVHPAAGRPHRRGGRGVRGRGARVVRPRARRRAALGLPRPAGDHRPAGRARRPPALRAGRPRRARRPAPARSRGMTRLDSALRATRHQKQWFADLRAEVAAGAPLALVNADAPQEIFRAMGIPYVVNQWWASIITAKRLGEDHLRRLRAHGYPDDSEQYNALPLGDVLAPDPTSAPWGGLPRPTIVLAETTGDASRKVFDIWGEQPGTTFYALESAAENAVPERWWELMPHRWEEAIGSDRLDLLVGELEGLIRFLETTT